MAKLVSVIIPAFNRADTIYRAIKSVLAQKYEELEIIVVDDASTDNTEEVVRGFQDKRVRYLRQSENRGAAAARNAGIEAARGEFAAFLDSDDEWLAGKLDKQMKLFEFLGDDFGVVYCGFNIVRSCRIKKTVMPKHRGDISAYIWPRNIVGTFSVAAARLKYIRAAGGLDESMRSFQDWDLYIRLSRICKFDFVNEPLVNFYMEYSLSRISNMKLSIVEGRIMIHAKYSAQIDKLPAKIKSEHFYNMSKCLLEVGALSAGMKDACRAFIRADNLKTLCRAFFAVFRGGMVLIKRKVLAVFYR